MNIIWDFDGDYLDWDATVEDDESTEDDEIPEEFHLDTLQPLQMYM
jgi:hypothetical protein